MSEFRDRLEDAIADWANGRRARSGSWGSLTDVLIESGVVADPAELARAEADWRREIEARGAEVKRADRAEIELATLRQHLQEQATADDPVTVPKSDVYDPKGYLWRDQWKWAVERAERAEDATVAVMLHAQREWSLATFGPGDRLAGLLDHLRKELAEVEANPTDVSEWIDVVILAFDGAWRSGHTPEQIVAALDAKYEKNRNREWPDWRTAPEGTAIEHVRRAEPETTP